MNPTHPRLRLLDPLANALATAAEAAARAATNPSRRNRTRPAYAGLRPGADTPLWNELARLCALRLKQRGAKARLARLLGVSRQRVHVLLVARTACPDAERTLQLLAWLHGQPSAPPSRPVHQPSRGTPHTMSSIK